MSRRSELSVTTATRSSLIVPSLFNSYDLCLNTYVGCQFGCAYCYVRFLVKSPTHAWGDFVKVREHVADKLPKELARGYFKVPDGKRPKVEDGAPVMKDGKQVKEVVYRTVLQKDARLVLGTTTDPYQPIEREHRVTRAALQALLAASPQLNKVGIFTRSPIVLDDLDLIVRLPRKRVHFTVTPYTPEVMKLIEPIAISTERRWDTIRRLGAAGVRCHVNVAPAIPVVSEQFTEGYAETLAEVGAAQFFVDPMQAYSESWAALAANLGCHPQWPAISAVMSDKQAYAAWKAEYKASWMGAWARVRHLSPGTLAIWSDHENKVWVDMSTGLQMDRRRYGDDLEGAA